MGPFASATYLTQTRQINSWYSNLSSFVFSSLPWFMRGATNTDGIYANTFAFGSTYGSVLNSIGFRLILTP